MAPPDPGENPPKEETPVPGTAAEGGRRKLGAYAHTYQPQPGEVQAGFFQRIAGALSLERLESYAADGASPTLALARYLLNMALCESLYSPLQLCEVALRNTLHRHLSARYAREDWYDAAAFPLTAWAQAEVAKAKARITAAQHAITPGRVIAELQFGFWTSLFESDYERRNGFLPAGIRYLFPGMPKSLHNRKGIKRTLEEIRLLRNRVFHHERIVHWQDLDRRHAQILEVISWITPELLDLARALDRFMAIRAGGLDPWLERIRDHWSHPEPPADSAPAN